MSSQVSCQEISNGICQVLDITEEDFLNLVGKTHLEDNSINKRKLLNIQKVLNILEREFPMISPFSYKEILINARVILDPEDPEDGSVALISYCACYHNEIPKSVILEAIKAI